MGDDMNGLICNIYKPGYGSCSNNGISQICNEVLLTGINCDVFNESEKIGLTQREAELLKLFLDNKNSVLKREQILTSLWGTDDYFMGRSLDVFISRLRKIIKDETNVRIENIPRVGFKLVVE
jgi:DNA-binding response OmpR family regulator